MGVMDFWRGVWSFDGEFGVFSIMIAGRFGFEGLDGALYGFYKSKGLAFGLLRDLLEFQWELWTFEGSFGLLVVIMGF